MVTRLWDVHFTVYTNILSCTPESNIMLYVNHTSTKKKNLETENLDSGPNFKTYSNMYMLDRSFINLMIKLFCKMEKIISVLFSGCLGLNKKIYLKV